MQKEQGEGGGGGGEGVVVDRQPVGGVKMETGEREMKAPNKDEKAVSDKSVA